MPEEEIQRLCDREADVLSRRFESNKEVISQALRDAFDKRYAGVLNRYIWGQIVRDALSALSIGPLDGTVYSRPPA